MSWNIIGTVVRAASLVKNVGTKISAGISSILSGSKQVSTANTAASGYQKDTNNGTKSSGNSGNSDSDGDGGGSGDGSDSDSSNDSTTENVMVNDPEKNKLLAEVRMSEELRETLSFTITIPCILKGLHTNQWLFMDVADGFYEENYGTVISTIANKKYGRYVGFEKGRFFVEKIRESGGVDGVSMEITLNPIASNYGQYTKMQMEAEKALIEALNDDTKYENNGGYGTGGSVNSSDLIGIGNELAEKYTFCGGVGSESYTEMKSRGCGSCFAWSGALYTELTAKGYTCRVIQYGTSQAWNHRSVEINNGGIWEDYPYRQTNIPVNARATSSKPGRFVIDDATLQSIL